MGAEQGQGEPGVMSMIHDCAGVGAWASRCVISDRRRHGRPCLSEDDNTRDGAGWDGIQEGGMRMAWLGWDCDGLDCTVWGDCTGMCGCLMLRVGDWVVTSPTSLS